jgi:hypothetical protein
MFPQFAIADDPIARTQLTIPVVVGRCDWLSDTARQFEAIGRLPDGWDGEGATHPDAPVLKTAWSFLVSLCSVGDVPRPHVNPTRAGGVQFDWDAGGRYFEIEFGTDGVISFFFRDDKRQIEENGDVRVDQPLERVLRYIHQVVMRGSDSAE